MNQTIKHSRRRSQKAAILNYLQAGGSLTPMEAIDLCGSMKLATRISELINKDGHTEINKRYVWVKASDGEMIKVMQYSIDPEMRRAV